MSRRTPGCADINPGCILSLRAGLRSRMQLINIVPLTVLGLLGSAPSQTTRQGPQAQQASGLIIRAPRGCRSSPQLVDLCMEPLHDIHAGDVHTWRIARYACSLKLSLCCVFVKSYLEPMLIALFRPPLPELLGECHPHHGYIRSMRFMFQQIYQEARIADVIEW